MAHHDDKWGVFFPVNDHGSALYAVRMGALHTFMLGLGILLICLVQFLTVGIPLVLIGIAAVLIALAIAVRAGYWRLGILTILLSVVLIVFSIVSLNWVGLIAGTLYFILALNAVRGWWFLWKNRAGPHEARNQ